MARRGRISLAPFHHKKVLTKVQWKAAVNRVLGYSQAPLSKGRLRQPLVINRKMDPK